MPRRKPRYFVVHLNGEDAMGNRGGVFQIQILDANGRAREVGYTGTSETDLVIGTHHVPQAVLAAARRQAIGTGDYVDETGTSMHPVLWIPRAPGD